jgi:hypothetical protein
MNNSFSDTRIFATVTMALIGSRRFTHMRRMNIDVKGKHILIHFATHVRPQNSHVMLLFMNAIKNKSVKPWRSRPLLQLKTTLKSILFDDNSDAFDPHRR